MSVNLLPEDPKKLAKTKAQHKLAASLLRISAFMAVVAVMSFALVEVYLNVERQKIESRQSDLVRQAKSLEPNEQRLALIRNRLQALSDSEKTAGTESLVKKMSEVFGSSNPALVNSARDLSIERGRTELVLSASTSASLTEFIGSFTGLEGISTSVGSLSFNPFTGYKLSLELQSNEE
jgi:hypothetical protein